jgi:hypothetical protein
MVQQRHHIRWYAGTGEPIRSKNSSVLVVADTGVAGQ